MNSFVKAIAVIGLSAAALVGCQGRAANGGYDTYRVTTAGEMAVFADGTTKTFTGPETYLGHGFKDTCEGKARLITMDGKDGVLYTHQFDNYSAAARPDCAKAAK